VRRVAAGELDSMATGDRKHSYDLLAQRIGPLRSTLVLCGAGALAATLGVVAAYVPTTAGVALAFLSGAGAVWAGARLYSLGAGRGATT
jgi:hypothetical protein